MVQPLLSSADNEKSSGGCESWNCLRTSLVCLSVHSSNLSRCSASCWKGKSFCKTTCWQQSPLHPDCNHMGQWSVSPHHDWFNARTLKHFNTAPLFRPRWLVWTMLRVKSSFVFLSLSLTNKDDLLIGICWIVWLIHVLRSMSEERWTMNVGQWGKMA